MLPFNRRFNADRPARDHAAGVIDALLTRTLAWPDVPARLGPSTTSDRAVIVITGELRSIAAEPTGSDNDHRDDDTELNAVLRRSSLFLKTDLPYRWHEKTPIQILGAYTGICALLWFLTGGVAFALGAGHEITIALALLSFAVTFIMMAAMTLALIQRMIWRLAVNREHADHRYWPFFSANEYNISLPGSAEDAHDPA